MTRSIALTVAGVLAPGAALAQKRLTLKDLPAPVQATVQNELKGGEIKSIGKETEDGVAQYEVETILNGKLRDFNVDAKGKLLVVEEETSIDSIPAAAKAAILKRVADGRLGMVELFLRGRRDHVRSGVHHQGRQEARGPR
jgi:hypothetical protein